jgi:hypothetical protein
VGLGEKNLSHLWRCGILAGDPTQRLPFGPGAARGTQKTRYAHSRPFGYAQGRRAGLKCGAPPAVRGEDLGNGSAFLD